MRGTLVIEQYTISFTVCSLFSLLVLRVRVEGGGVDTLGICCFLWLWMDQKKSSSKCKDIWCPPTPAVCERLSHQVCGGSRVCGARGAGVPSGSVYGAGEDQST